MEIQLDLLNLMTGTGAPLLMQQDAEKKAVKTIQK